MLDVIGILAALGIVVWATWALVRALAKGEPKAGSFKAWLRWLLEAVGGM